MYLVVYQLFIFLSFLLHTVLRPVSQAVRNYTREENLYNNKQDNKIILWIDNLARTAILQDSDKFDIVYIGHVLTEISSADEIIIIVDTLWNFVKDDGFMIYVDNGSPKSARFAHDFRDYILKK